VSELIFSLSINISPLSGLIRPAIHFNTVDFPTPFIPRMQVIFPSSILKDILSNALTFLYFLLTFFTSINTFPSLVLIVYDFYKLFFLYIYSFHIFYKYIHRLIYQFLSNFTYYIFISSYATLITFYCIYNPHLFHLLI